MRYSRALSVTLVVSVYGALALMLFNELRRFHFGERVPDESIISGMGNILPDGTLRLRLPILEVRDLGIQVRLVHGITMNSEDRAVSNWTPTGIVTYLKMQGDKLVWHATDGNFAYFTRSQIDGVLRKAGPSNCRIRKVGEESYEIEDSSSRLWRYENGRVCWLRHGEFGIVKFDTEGARILKVIHLEEHMSRNLLWIEFNAFGDLTAITDASGTTARCEWSQPGVLKRIHLFDGGTFEIAYERDLIVRLANPDSSVISYEWKENPAFNRLHTRIPHQVWLSRDSYYVYDFFVDQYGYHAVAITRGDKVRTETIYNPLRGILTQKGPSGLLFAPPTPRRPGNNGRS